MTTLLEVSRDDLEIVTNAILENWYSQYTCGSGRENTSCNYCGKYQEYDYKNYCVPDPSHEPNCAVLVAISISPRPIRSAASEQTEPTAHRQESPSGTTKEKQP